MYFREVLPVILNVNRSHVRNGSVASLGWRIFEGTGSPVIFGATAPPLVENASLALITSTVLPLLVVVVSCIVIRHRRLDLDASLGVFICISILVSPISWPHYQVLLAIQ